MTERPQNKHLKPVQPGEVRNPNGRPKGSKHKLGEAFVAALLADFEEHGADVIQEIRETKPDIYLKVIASIIPKDVNITADPLENMTDDELRLSIKALEEIVRPILDGGDDTDTDTKH
ncbi:MAG: hypothetical protein ABJN26_06220 [Stappiaceae bacterium]